MCPDNDPPTRFTHKTKHYQARCFHHSRRLGSRLTSGRELCFLLESCHCNSCICFSAYGYSYRLWRRTHRNPPHTPGALQSGERGHHAETLLDFRFHGSLLAATRSVLSWPVKSSQTISGPRHSDYSGVGRLDHPCHRSTDTNYQESRIHNPVR